MHHINDFYRVWTTAFVEVEISLCLSMQRGSETTRVVMESKAPSSHIGCTTNHVTTNKNTKGFLTTKMDFFCNKRYEINEFKNFVGTYHGNFFIFQLISAIDIHYYHKYWQSIKQLIFGADFAPRMCIHTVD